MVGPFILKLSLQHFSLGSPSWSGLYDNLFLRLFIDLLVEKPPKQPFLALRWGLGVAHVMNA